MDKQQKDKEDKASIIKMVRELKAKELHNCVAVIEKYHYITLAKQDKRCACHHDQERTPFPLHLVSGHDDAYSIKKGVRTMHSLAKNQHQNKIKRADYA